MEETKAGRHTSRLERELAGTQQRLAVRALALNVLDACDTLSAQLLEFAHLARTMLAVDACVIREVRGEWLELAAVAGTEADLLQRQIPLHGQGMLSPLVQSGERVIIADVRTDARYRGEPALIANGPFISYLGVPISGRRGLLGVLCVFSCDTVRAFTEEEAELLKIIAQYIAVAFQVQRTISLALLGDEDQVVAANSGVPNGHLYRDAMRAIRGVPYRRRFGEPRYEFLGAGIVELTGFFPEELTPAFFASRVRQQRSAKLESLDQAEEQALSVGSWDDRWNRDFLFEHKDGSLIWISASSTPWVDEQNIVGAVGVLRDVSELKRTEETLRERETRLQTILDSVPECVALVSADGALLEVSAGGRSVFGVDDSVRLRGVQMVDFIAPDDQELFHLFLGRSCVGRTELVEFQIVPRRGQLRLVEAQAVPLRDGQGMLTAVLCVARDVTERQELEMQLRQSQRMEAVGHLAGGVAHDFNNLLTGILGLIELAMISCEDRMLMSDLREIRRLGERGADLTRQLLAFSRHTVSKPTVFNLNDVIEEMRTLLRTLVGENVELELILDPGIGLVRADPSQMEQVIVNLAVNARDAMDSGGKLTIRTRHTRHDEDTFYKRLPRHSLNYVMLSVTDTGHGMSPEVRERVFEPFFTTKEPGRGTGLGLATVYGIVKQSDGGIRVLSQPGQGTTFQICIPSVQDPKPAVAEPSGSTEDPTGTEMILIVEDELSVRQLISRVFRHRGYRVLEARDGQEALEMFGQHGNSIHLVITDVIMPQMGGAVLAKRLRELRPDLKMLFISGYTNSDLNVDELLDQNSVFVQKPFSPALLASKVRELLDSTPAFF